MTNVLVALASVMLAAVVSAGGDYGYGGGYGYSQDYNKYITKYPVGDIYGFGASYGSGYNGGSSYGGGYGGNSYGNNYQSYGGPPVTYIPGYGKYVPYSMPLYGNYGPPAHVPHYEQSYGYQKSY